MAQKIADREAEELKRKQEAEEKKRKQLELESETPAQRKEREHNQMLESDLQHAKELFDGLAVNKGIEST